MITYLGSSTFDDSIDDCSSMTHGSGNKAGIGKNFEAFQNATGVRDHSSRRFGMLDVLMSEPWSLRYLAWRQLIIASRFTTSQHVISTRAAPNPIRRLGVSESRRLACVTMNSASKVNAAPDVMLI